MTTDTLKRANELQAIISNRTARLAQLSGAESRIQDSYTGKIIIPLSTVPEVEGFGAMQDLPKKEIIRSTAIEVAKQGNRERLKTILNKDYGVTMVSQISSEQFDQFYASLLSLGNIELSISLELLLHLIRTEIQRETDSLSLAQTEFNSL